MPSYRIGIDIGGTFTDFVLVREDSGGMRFAKALTTPRDPSECVLAGVRDLLAEHRVPIDQVQAIVHGTTLATNAVIERRGATTGLLTTKGFGDLLDLGRETRYDLFDLRAVYPAPLVPRSLRRELTERLRYDGEVLEPLDAAEVERMLDELVHGHHVEALAVCLLHAYANPVHEQQVQALARARFPHLAVSTSSDVFPFMGEYERFSTTTMNAYVQPMIDRYLDRLERELAGQGFRGRLYVMTSAGGTMTLEAARRFPVRLLESGPVAGALMSASLGRQLGAPDLLSFDMGGTTAKGCIVLDHEPRKRYALEVARVHEFKPGSGLPVRGPFIDMVEIGAGGGSIAEVDARGLIRVGPRSAGADPGPACYGRGGTRATLTDANVLLGYLDPAFFNGGRMTLDVEAAREAVTTHVARPLGLTPTAAAWGIHEIINEDVARAFRVHAAERGVDYRRCGMVAFGGSGPIHALRVARKLRNHRRQIAACAVAADCEPVRIDVEFLRVLGHPLGRGEAILDPGGKLVLGREPVVDRNGDASDLVGERAAWRVVRIEIADDPSAAMKENQHRERPTALRRIDANRNRTGRPGNLPILDLENFFDFLRRHLEHFAGQAARVGRRERMNLRARRGGDLIEQYFYLRVERHDSTSGASLPSYHSQWFRTELSPPTSATISVRDWKEC